MTLKIQYVVYTWILLFSIKKFEKLTLTICIYSLWKHGKIVKIFLDLFLYTSIAYLLGFNPSDQWTSTSEPSDYWTFWLVNLLTSEPSDFEHSDLVNLLTIVNLLISESYPMKLLVENVEIYVLVGQTVRQPFHTNVVALSKTTVPSSSSYILKRPTITNNTSNITTY